MDFETIFESLPSGSWTEVKKNIHCFKNQDASARVYPNCSTFGDVSEWQSDCFRICSTGVKIEGRSIRSGNFDECKAFLEKELNYLLTISVPERSL